MSQAALDAQFARAADAHRRGDLATAETVCRAIVAADPNHLRADSERLIFAPPLERDLYLARLAAADLFLDTFPYNAHNTATEALWAGVPLITCTGSSMAARVATSVLAAAGVPELAAPSLAEYEALALALARDPVRLSALRARLAAARERSPLFERDRYRRGLEAAYLTMWQRHTTALPPASFAVRGAT